MSHAPITEADLHAYLDGQLAEARRVEVEAYLASRPEEAERVRAWGAQNEALRALFDPVLQEPVPERLAAHGRRPGFAPMRHAAVVAWVALGAVLGWGLASMKPEAPQVTARAGLARDAMIAHVVYSPEVRHPVEVGADQEQHLVAWLSKRLGGEVAAPKLAGLGFELVGGRLLPAAEGPAAQFMYQDAAGRRLTLYVRPRGAEAEETAFRFAEEAGVGVFYWVDRSFGYALSGKLERAELLRVSEAVYRQLNP